jgi:hypothetical protein
VAEGGSSLCILAQDDSAHSREALVYQGKIITSGEINNVRNFATYCASENLEGPLGETPVMLRGEGIAEGSVCGLLSPIVPMIRCSLGVFGSDLYCRYLENKFEGS